MGWIMSCYSSSSMLSSLVLRKSSSRASTSRQLLYCSTWTHLIRNVNSPQRRTLLQVQHLSIMNKDSIQQQQQTGSNGNNNNNKRSFFSGRKINDNTTNDTLFGTLLVAAAVSILSSVSILYGTTQYESSTGSNNKNNVTLCEEAVVTVPKTIKKDNLVVEKDSKIQKQEEVDVVEEVEELFYGLFPKRQLYQPKLEYPLWDDNWDGLQPVSTGNNETDKQNTRQIRKDGITKHILLIRHGQYDETYKDDTKRILTPLGISQAHYTGQRIQQLMMSLHPANNTISNTNTDTDNTNTNTIITATGTTIQTKNYVTPCNIRTIRVSCLTRAKETANIIASYLITQPEQDEQQQSLSVSSSATTVQYISDGDCNLNEGRPCHTIPPMSGTADKKLIKTTDEQHPRIEKAFQTYFYRNTTIVPSSDSTSTNGITDSTSTTITNTNNNAISIDEKHEFEIIVCHANVIRYFVCRALQLPPETWLRYCPFNCSITYLTIRPTGTVSCRMIGDIGHLPYNHCTFSQHHGFNW